MLILWVKPLTVRFSFHPVVYHNCHFRPTVCVWSNLQSPERLHMEIILGHSFIYQNKSLQIISLKNLFLILKTLSCYSKHFCKLLTGSAYDCHLVLAFHIVFLGNCASMFDLQYDGRVNRARSWMNKWRKSEHKICFLTIADCLKLLCSWSENMSYSSFWLVLWSYVLSDKSTWIYQIWCSAEST